MKDKNFHICKDMDKSAVIYKWQIGDGHEDLIGKWTLDIFGMSGERDIIVIKYCPYCGEEL